jgi:hypothetical protein
VAHTYYLAVKIFGDALDKNEECAPDPLDKRNIYIQFHPNARLLKVVWVDAEYLNNPMNWENDLLPQHLSNFSPQVSQRPSTAANFESFRPPQQ